MYLFSDVGNMVVEMEDTPAAGKSTVVGTAEEKKEEGKTEESKQEAEEESDEDFGFGLFD